jgi:hypothetical protein
MSRVAKVFSRFDGYTKSRGDYVHQRTLLGGSISVVGAIVMLALTISEFMYYREVTVENHLEVDTRQGERLLDIMLDINFFHLKCEGGLLRQVLCHC